MPCPGSAHAAPLPWRVAKGLDCVFPLHSAAVFDSHIPCHAHAVLRPSDFSRAQHGRGAAWYVWINIGHLEKACGRPTQVRLLPATTRSSMTVVIRISNWNAAGQCETKQRLLWARRSWLFWCENMSIIQLTAQRLR